MSRKKKQRKRSHQDRPRTLIVPDMYHGSKSLPVKLNRKQLGKLISHLIEIQNDDDDSDDDQVDPQGNYQKGKLAVVPSNW